MSMNYLMIAKLMQAQALSKGSAIWSDSGSSTNGLGMGSSSSDLFSLLLLSLLGGDNASSLLGNSGLNGSGSSGLLSLLTGSSALNGTASSYTGNKTAGVLGAGTNTQYDSIIQEAAATYHVDPNLLKAVIQTESGFNANAVSSAGAQGLMQLMPGTARGLGVTNSFDPYQNIMGGAKYLAQQLKNFDGDVKLALCAYNTGPGRISQLGVTSSNNVTQYAKISSIARNYAEKVLSRCNALTQNGRG